MKYILITMTLLVPSLVMMAQDTTRVFINNKKAAEVIIVTEAPEARLEIKSSCLKNLKSIYIQVKGEHINGDPYKRSLEVSGENSTTAEETENKPGHFKISETFIKDQLIPGKTVSLYLLLNPSNPMMAMPSKRVFVGKLVIK